MSKKILLRENQKPPQGDWFIWLILAGRGFGKTLAGSHAINQFVNNDCYRYVGLLGHTLLEVEKVMINGPSGIKTHFPDVKYSKKSRSLIWPNGGVANIFSDKQFENLRGSQFDLLWIDELSKFIHKYQVWEQILLVARINNPKVIITTTGRSCGLLEEIQKRPDTITTIGSSFDNAENLAQSFILNAEQQKQNHWGMQEIYGENIVHQPHIWPKDSIIYSPPNHQDIYYKVLGIDPSIKENGNVCGMVLLGMNQDKKIVVLQDYSRQLNPAQFSVIISELVRAEKIDHIAIEINQGGDVWHFMLQKQGINPRSIFTHHAKQGKLARRAPIVLLYQQRCVLHAQIMQKLEEQMFGLSKEDDRVDALIIGINHCLNFS